TTGAFDAYAEGGLGYNGGHADAEVFGVGHAHAVGGDVYDSSAGSNGNGGDADARASGSGSTALAQSGDALNNAQGGVGGTATAWGPPPNPGFNSSFSGTWQGSTEVWP